MAGYVRERERHDQGDRGQGLARTGRNDITGTSEILLDRGLMKKTGKVDRKGTGKVVKTEHT